MIPPWPWARTSATSCTASPIASTNASLRKQANELNDLFLLLCYMEVVGLPNPATLYMLDIYPYLLDQFHLWHRRMGMDRSPLGNLPCC